MNAIALPASARDTAATALGVAGAAWSLVTSTAEHCGPFPARLSKAAER